MKTINFKVLFIFIIFIELIMILQIKAKATNQEYSLGSNIIDDNYIRYNKEVEKSSTILASSAVDTTTSTTSNTSGSSIILFIIAIAVIIELVAIFIKAIGIEEDRKRKKTLYK